MRFVAAGLQPRVQFALTALCLVLAPTVALAQPRTAGKATYRQLCARCHGADGRGGEFAPDIVARAAAKSDAELGALIRQGIPAKGMPPSTLTTAAMRGLVAFVRTFRENTEDAPTRLSVTSDEGPLQGVVLTQSATGLALRDDDGRIHLLRRSGEQYRTVTSQADWPTYNGQPTGSRFSALTGIDTTNVGRLAPAWTFTLDGASRLEVTPVVVDGVMYVTNANECYALDAGSGRQLWHFKRPRTRGLSGDAAGGINRGVAVAGDRVFMVTDHAHIIALSRSTGTVLWDTAMADWRLNYGATSAPLAAGGLVISGTSGGDEGIRGFLAAFDQATGREVWRVWTVPRPGEPGSETWRGRDILHPCASAWLTGTYDAALETVYWPTGNPCPDYDGSQRVGDNLYSDSILALDLKSGRLKWHYQYTPHDLWDWDSQQTAALVDADWHGQPRHLLLHANRNGFFYVLDRTDGALLLAKPFVKKLTWAREIGADGRPVQNPDQVPNVEGVKVCPSVDGATNWFSTAFSPATGLYYVQALESCNIYSRAPSTWKAGQSYYSGDARRVPGEQRQKVLRAIDIQTGEIRWEAPQEGNGSTWGGVLATAGGVVIAAADDGALMAVDAKDGRRLWRFDANAHWKASPMTYVFDNRQYVAIAAGPTIIAFAVVDEK